MTDVLKLRFEDHGETVKVFLATDVTLHRRKPTNPHTLVRQLSKSVRNGQSGRAYAESFRHERVGEAVRINAFFPFCEEDKRQMANLKAQGKKIEFVIPTELPLFVR